MQRKLTGHAAASIAMALIATAACSNSTSASHEPAPSPSKGNVSIGTLSPAAHGNGLKSPFDATPDPDGKNVYFTAIGSNGPGVFKVAAKGGPVSQLFAGSPLVAPFSIAISTDGGTLFVADLGASTSKTDGGTIFSLPVSGGTPEDIGAVDGMFPHGLEVSGDDVYFTGASNGSPGVFKMGVGGGAVTTLASGAPFKQPSGVAIAKNGDLYVVDGSSTNALAGRILKVTPSGQVSVYLDNIAVGYPAGIVFNQAESQLLVSARDSAKGTDAVLVIDVPTATYSEFTSGIDSFVEPAGLHRAHSANVFAWADSTANKAGTVYVIEN
jgi:DNA-binding beta-propeller fold protein YncE